ncbi:MAG: ATP-dependent DNA helicase, partial [Nevskiales bacterium]
LAYLVPALLSGSKVIISTGTKNLQEQLFHKDLPALQATLPQPRKVSLLKGRSNYLCRHRMEQAISGGRLHNKKQVRLLRDIRIWAGQTDTGDLAEVGDTADGSAVWRMVSSTTENCLSTDCAFYDQCEVFQARKRAQEADVVIINHHLLLADIALKERGVGELLPAADAIVVDEAHQLPHTAAQFFGQRLSFYQVNDLINDTRAALKGIGRDMPALEAAVLALGKSNESLLIQLSGPAQRMDWNSPAIGQSLEDSLVPLRRALAEASEQISAVAERSKELDNCAERYAAMQSLLAALQTDDPEQVRWFERSPQSYIFYLTPLDISEPFSQYRDSSHAAWVMTSATLTVNGKFEHFSTQLGMQTAQTLSLESPFDYPHHA